MVVRLDVRGAALAISVPHVAPLEATGELDVRALVSPVSFEAGNSRPDPLAPQQMQPQDFETSKEPLFAATVSVFQNRGSTIKPGDLETGLVTAKRTTSIVTLRQFGFV